MGRSVSFTAPVSLKLYGEMKRKRITLSMLGKRLGIHPNLISYYLRTACETGRVEDIEFWNQALAAIDAPSVTKLEITNLINEHNNKLSPAYVKQHAPKIQNKKFEETGYFPVRYAARLLTEMFAEDRKILQKLTNLDYPTPQNISTKLTLLAKTGQLEGVDAKEFGNPAIGASSIRIPGSSLNKLIATLTTTLPNELATASS